MVLVDTSIWIEHLRSGSLTLAALLNKALIVTHPFIVGELACGNLKHRKKFMSLLSELPSAVTASHDEVLELIDAHKLMGQGIGWIDANLLASSLLSGTPLWSGDRRLRSIAAVLGVLY